ncbi:MAG: hypothetical protein WBI29_01035, partial [Candidatus Saccharimonadales bacterium]
PYNFYSRVEAMNPGIPRIILSKCYITNHELFFQSIYIYIFPFCELPPPIEVDGFLVNTTIVASLPKLSRSNRPL